MDLSSTFKASGWHEWNGFVVKTPAKHPSTLTIVLLNGSVESTMKTFESNTGWVCAANDTTANLEMLCKFSKRLGILPQDVLVCFDFSHAGSSIDLLLKLESANCIFIDDEGMDAASQHRLATAFSNLVQNPGERLAISKIRCQELIPSTNVSDHLFRRLLTEVTEFWPAIALSGGSLQRLLERQIAGLGKIPAPRLIQNEIESTAFGISGHINARMDAGVLGVDGQCYSLAPTELVIFADFCDSDNETIINWPLGVKESPQSADFAHNLIFAVHSSVVFEVDCGIATGQIDLFELDPGEYSLSFTDKNGTPLALLLNVEREAIEVGDKLLVMSVKDCTLQIMVH